MMFRAIKMDPQWFVQGWLIPCGAMGAVIIGSWLVEQKQSVVENMAPVIVFLPAFGYRLRLLVRSDGHPIERVPYTSVIRSGPVRGRCRIR
jgi:hypothetical protein